MSEVKSLTIIRTFDVPIEKVWDAWTTPDGWATWYGQPWENPRDSVAMDVKVGGRWKSTTVAEGNRINFSGTYTAVDKPHKLVMTFENPEDPTDGKIETVTVVLKDVDGKTEMNFEQAGGNLPPEEYQNGLKKGWGGFFDALEAYLTQ